MGSEQRNSAKAIREVADDFEFRVQGELTVAIARAAQRGITERQLRSELRRRGWPVAAKPGGAT